MGGSQSNIVSDASDADILKTLGADGYKQSTQDALLSSVRSADTKVHEWKSSYGTGVSVMGMIINVAGKHFLEREDSKVRSGKAWNDSETHEPAREIDILTASPFFHAKSDSAATGSCAGFDFYVIDANGIQQFLGDGGKKSKIRLGFAWENPYSGKLSTAAEVVTDDSEGSPMSSALDWVQSSDNSGKSKNPTNVYHGGSQVTTWTGDSSTAYVIYVVKTDLMVEANSAGKLSAVLSDFVFTDSDIDSILEGKPATKELLGSQSFTVDANTVGSSISYTFSQSMTSTFSWGLTQTLGVSVAVEFSAGIPLIGGVKTTVTATVTLGANQTWTNSETKTVSVSGTMKPTKEGNYIMSAFVDIAKDVTLAFDATCVLTAKTFRGEALEWEIVRDLYKAQGNVGTILSHTDTSVTMKMSGTMTGTYGMESHTNTKEVV